MDNRLAKLGFIFNEETTDKVADLCAYFSTAYEREVGPYEVMTMAVNVMWESAGKHEQQAG